MGLAISTCPDIFNAIQSIARYCSAPKAIPWKAALGILAYINGTRGFGITYQRGASVGILIEIFADEDYANKATDKKSVSCGALICGDACVCWFSRTQKYVTFSTSEAAYADLGDAVKELLSLRQVWRFMIRECRVFLSLEATKGLCSSRITRRRTQIRSTSMFVIISWQSWSARGTYAQTMFLLSINMWIYLLTKVLAFDMFTIRQRFLINLSD